MKKKSRWLALQLKVLNFYDNTPVMAWGCFVVIAGLATLFTAVGLFMAYCRIQRLEIILSVPDNLSKVLLAHDGPISPELLDTLRSVAADFGVRGKFEVFVAQYEAPVLPTTQVAYDRLIALAEEAEYEKLR